MNENKSGFVKLIHTFPVPTAAITERLYKSATTNLSHTLLRHVGLDGTASHAVRASPRPPTHAHTPRITTPFISLSLPVGPFFLLPPLSPSRALSAHGPTLSAVTAAKSRCEWARLLTRLSLPGRSRARTSTRGGEGKNRASEESGEKTRGVRGARRGIEIRAR
jgi:hypothetical protein